MNINRSAWIDSTAPMLAYATEQPFTDIAETSVDYVSIGDVSKQVTPLDLSMLFGQRT